MPNVMASTSSLSSNTRCLVEKAFESIQNDFQSELQKSNEMLREEIAKVINDMRNMKRGMKSMQEYIEHMHRQNPLSKKKVDEFEEKLKERDEEIERLKKELSEYKDAQNERIEVLVNFKAGVEEEAKKAAEREEAKKAAEREEAKKAAEREKAKKAAEKEEAKRAAVKDEQAKRAAEISEPQTGTSGGKDKNFEFKEKVEGDKVIIGAEMAVISEGGDMKFLDPLQSNDPNSMLNKDGEMPMGSGGGGPSGAVKVDIDGALVGNETVNIQQSMQKIFISGPKEENIEEYDDGEKIDYRQADADELTRFLEKARDETLIDEDEEVIELSPDEKLQQHEVIIRVSELIKQEGKVEHFKSLCDLLKNLTPRQLRSLAPQLGHIVRIDLTGVKFDYQSLSAFFRCFKAKKFYWLLLRYTNILAADMRMLGSSLSGCKIAYLDLGNCSFEYMAFFELASVLIHIEYLILTAITAAKIIPENAQGPIKPFTAGEARHLADSISRRNRPITISLTYCDLTSVDIAAAFSMCMDKVTSLTLQNSTMYEMSVNALLGPVQKIEKLDFACAQLRNSGVKGVAAHIAKADVLILCNVMMDDQGVEPLLDALESLEEKQLDVFDISNNPIGAENISKLLKLSGKARVMIFSKDQIFSYEKNSADVDDEKVLLSEVVDGKPVRLEEGASADDFSYWATCTKPIEDKEKKLLMQATRFSPADMQARMLRNYMCIKCRTHIAFAKDEMIRPCPNLLHDRNLFGVLDHAHFVAVSHAVSCIPGTGGAKKHNCSNPNCQLAKYKMRTCKCAVCQQTLGGYYFTKTGQRFWCLYQKSQGGPLVGIAGQSCKQM